MQSFSRKLCPFSTNLNKVFHDKLNQHNVQFSISRFLKETNELKWRQKNYRLFGIIPILSRFLRDICINKYKTLSNKRFSKVLEKNHSKPNCVIVVKENYNMAVWELNCLQGFLIVKLDLTSLKILQQSHLVWLVFICT